MEWQRKDKQAKDGWVKKFALIPVNCDIIELGGRSSTEKYDRTVWLESYMYMEHVFSIYGKVYKYWMAITRMTYLGLTNEQRAQWANAMKQIVEKKALSQ